MRKGIVSALGAAALLLAGVGQASAGLATGGSLGTGGPSLAGPDPAFLFTFTIGSNTGSASLLATDNLDGTFQATSGTLTVTGGAAAGTYSLYPNPSPPNVVSSPSGAFIIDNQLYPSQIPLLDVFGLLFLGAGGLEVNIWGNSPDNYSFYQFTPGVGYTVADTADTTGNSPSLTPVPEPASMTLLGLGVAGLAGFGWRRRKAVVA